MEVKDKRPNIIAIIGAIVLLVLAVVGLSYAFFSAFINGGETDTSVEGTGANLSLVYADGKSVITSSNIMPGWSATKTFTVTNNGEADAYYKLKISDINNYFVGDAISFLITSTDGGANIEEQSVGCGSDSRVISLAIPIEVGKTHTYIITTKYRNLDMDQTPDLGNSFKFKISIESSQKETAPNGWEEAESGTLLAALRENNELKPTITKPINNVSAHTIDDVQEQSQNVYTHEVDRYATYATGWKSTLEWGFEPTGVSVANDTYKNSYQNLIGKYIQSTNFSSISSVTPGDKKTTISYYTYYVTNATLNKITYKLLSSNQNTTEALLASTKDDYGTSYYFRGAVKNNYVEFANKCWRIVRIVGDGSVKLVLHNDNMSNVTNPCSSINNSDEAAFAHYDGTTYKSSFNDNHDDNAYFGFMYGTAGSSDYASTHANINKSTILRNLETWYKKNLAAYTDKLADTIWCNSKRISGGSGYGTNKTYYSIGTNFICPNDSNDGDLSKFTVDDTTNGNGALDYKIGLLTANEVFYAGYMETNSISNNSAYLQENMGDNMWWTLSPASYGHINNTDDPLNYVLENYITGLHVSRSRVNNNHAAIRPSISLVSNIEISGGSGTSEDPYVVK